MVPREGGDAIAVSADAVAEAIARGYRVEGTQEANARLVQEQRDAEVSGFGNTLATGIQHAVDAATLGGYGALVGAAGGGDMWRQLEHAHGTAAGIGDFVGTVAPAIATLGGSLLARGGATGLAEATGAAGRLFEATPAALTTRLGMRIAEAGEGLGLLGRTGARIAGGAAEGVIQGVGGYISDVALGDKELSADGFVGAMGHGALWGGGAAGALSVAGDAFTAARRLFPKQEITKVAVQKAEQEAVAAVRETVEDSKQLVDEARRQLKTRREVLSQDPAIKAQLDEIAVNKARELAEAETAAARAKASEAGAKAELAQVKLDKAKAGPAPRKTRKAIAGEGEPASLPTPTEAAAGAAADATAATAKAATAAVGGATEDAATLLERQLNAMKSGIDQGETLASLSAKRPTTIGGKATAVEDAVNAHLAKVDPDAAKLVRAIDNAEGSLSSMDAWLSKYGGKQSNVGKFERSQAARDTADSWRSNRPGYYSKVPAGEGTADLGRGREWNWRGSEESRVHAEDMFYARQGGRDALEAQTKRIFPELPAENAIDGQIAEALGGKTDDIGRDLDEIADAVGQAERAHADLSDAVGPSSSVRSQDKAKAFRDAESGAEKSATEATVQHATDAEKAANTIGLTGELPGGAGGSSAVDKALRAGDVLEMAKMLGLPVPDTANIPVIGPVLSAVMKARLAAKAFGRFGGKVGATAETTIATKATQTKQRVYDAVDRMLEVGGKVAPKVGLAAAQPAVVLGHMLFDDREPGERAPKVDSKNIGDMYAARLDELTRAAQPGAVAAAVKARIKTSDPAIVDAIAAAQERKLSYLYSKAPKPDSPLGILQGGKWTPAPMEIREFARIVQATENPAGVLERVAAGEVVKPDEIDAIKNVYPKLYADAQQRIITQGIDAKNPLPYAKRVQLSLLFDIPLDGTMRPEYAAFLQSDYKAPPPAPQPTPQTPTPTIAADVTIGQATNPYGRTT